MTQPLRPAVTLDDLMTVTGLGPKQVRREVRLGNLPGRFVGRTFSCPADEFDAWRARFREQSRPVDPVPPVNFVTRRKSA